MPQTVAQLVDTDIQNTLDVGKVAELLIELSIDWQPNLSKEEYIEFVKRNLKEFVKMIETELEDRI